MQYHETQLKCKDCVAKKVTTVRPLHRIKGKLAPGPRCATHYREFTKAQKSNSHDSMVQRTYKLAPGEYAEIKEFQRGTCAICRRAKGTVKALAVDHDHKCCNKTPTCGKCNRGLLCGPCNQLLGRVGDNIAFFENAIDYLVFPPIPRFRRRKEL